MKFLLVCVTSLLLVVSTGASARGYGHHGYGHGYRHSGYGHHGSDAGYLFGGLLLGSILAQPRYAPPPRVVYVPQPTNNNRGCGASRTDPGNDQQTSASGHQWKLFRT